MNSCYGIYALKMWKSAFCYHILLQLCIVDLQPQGAYIFGAHKCHKKGRFKEKSSLKVNLENYQFIQFIWKFAAKQPAVGALKIIINDFS